MSDFPEFQPGHSFMEWAELAQRAHDCGIGYVISASPSTIDGRILFGMSLWPTYEINETIPRIFQGSFMAEKELT